MENIRSTTTAPPGDADQLDRDGASMLIAAMELQSLARGRDPLVDTVVPASTEPLTRLLAFGFAFSALLAVALVVELLTA